MSKLFFKLGLVMGLVRFYSSALSDPSRRLFNSISALLGTAEGLGTVGPGLPSR